MRYFPGARVEGMVDSQARFLRTSFVPHAVPERGGAVMPFWSIWEIRQLIDVQISLVWVE